MLYDQIRHFRLLDLQIGLRLQHLPHLQAVGLLIALGTRRPDRRTARGVQQAELDAHSIRDLAHNAAQRIDFAHQVTLGDATYGRVARHLCDQVDVEGVKASLQTHARGRHGGFATGMACTNNDDIELLGEGPHRFYSSNRNDLF